MNDSTPWGFIVCMSIVAAILCAASAYIGDYNGFERGRAYQKQLTTPTCPCLNRPQVRWQCDAVERREYLHVCLKRKAG